MDRQVLKAAPPVGTDYWMQTESGMWLHTWSGSQDDIECLREGRAFTEEARRAATGAEFLAAVRGIPTHHVVHALNTMTPGSNWAKCPKSYIAECFDREWRGRLKSVDVLKLARRAKARADGSPAWREVS